MSIAIRGGLVLGLLVVAWIFFMGFTGWYRHPVLLFAFWLVVPVQIGVLIWSLGQTASRHGYLSQLGLGMAVSATGGVLIFLGSLLFTLVVFPHYLEEVRALQVELLRQAGKSEAEIRSLMELTARDATPVGQATAGLIGTLVTGFVASIGIAAFARRKGAAPPHHPGA
jgi:hypothetical protein